MQSFFENDGLRMSYHVDDFTDPWEKAQTIVLLHGAMSSARRFYSWVPRLSRHYRVVRLDLRGHGGSEVPPADAALSLDHLVSDAVALLDHLGCDSAHVVGNSTGGYVGQQLAIQHPRRVQTLALYASTPGLRRSQVGGWIPQMREMGFRRFFAETLSDRFPPDVAASPLAAWFLDEICKNDPDYIARFLLALSTLDWSEDLHRITCPTLIVVPGAEPIGSVGEYEPMKQRIPRGEMLVYDGARHSVGDYLADRCVSDLLGFLARRS